MMFCLYCMHAYFSLVRMCVPIALSNDMPCLAAGLCDEWTHYILFTIDHFPAYSPSQLAI